MHDAVPNKITISDRSALRKTLGAPVSDRRSAALVRGAGQFAADIALQDPLHLAFVRSPVADAKLMGVDMDAARRAPGVSHVVTAADLGDLGVLAVNEVIKLHTKPNWPVLAGETLDAVGQPVAAILAETIDQALDASDLVEPIFDEQCRDRERVASQTWQSGDTDEAFANAAHIVACDVQHARLAPSPMETRAISVRCDDEGGLTIWHSTQTPHRTRSELASILGLDAEFIQVIARDVGGAFGMKASLYPEEVLAVWAAHKFRRNVRWSASRSEDFLSATHGRGLSTTGQLAVANDGRFLGLRAQVEAPVGRWLPNSGLIPAWNGARILPGPYDVDTVHIETQAVANNLAPVGIYRGAGRPEANFLMEKLVEKAAAVTGLSPIQIRRRNLVPAGQMPKSTPTGNILDSGNYSRLLATLESSGAYATRIAKRDAARAEGLLHGVGIAFYVEPSGEGWESARATLNTDGTVHIASGSSGQGQARETAYAQIAADALNLPLEFITAACGDTALSPQGIGALASRGTAIGGSAVLEVCQKLLDLRAKSDELPLTVEVRYENKGQAWGCGAYLVEVCVDADTGEIDIIDVFNADDAGRIVNPAFALGQIRGGFAQGLGEALMEQIVYDEHGQLLTGSLMDYALPRADQMPPLQVEKLETPSPMNSLGAKGIGEAGTIGAPPAIFHAVLDALSPLGVTDLQMPLTPARVWQAIQDAQGPKP
ncbi:MAG: xanthine dehydrogenase family protein molybdopterin-binding subunit [Pseudomonadota bacterium]